MPKQLTLKELEAKIDQNGTLDLSLLKLKDISCLKKLKNSKFIRKIKALDLSDNKITFDDSLPENLLTVNSEKVLELCPIPEIIRQNLEMVNLSNNHCQRVPGYFGLCRNLRKLDFYNNDLKDLNLDVFGNANKLAWLDVTQNDNLSDEARALVSRSNDHAETARNVKNYYTEKYTKAAKLREKRKKTQDKKNEKLAKELKLKQKEERRKAYEEAQKKLQEERDQAESEASSDEASTDLDQAAGDQNGSRKNSLAEKASSNSPGIFGTLVNAITGFIAAIFRAVFAVFYYLIVVPVKFFIYLTYVLIKYGVVALLTVGASVGVAHVTCRYLPPMEQDQVNQVCHSVAVLVERLVGTYI